MQWYAPSGQPQGNIIDPIDSPGGQANPFLQRVRNNIIEVIPRSKDW